MNMDNGYGYVMQKACAAVYLIYYNILRTNIMHMSQTHDFYTLLGSPNVPFVIALIVRMLHEHSIIIPCVSSDGSATARHWNESGGRQQQQCADRAGKSPEATATADTIPTMITNNVEHTHAHEHPRHPILHAPLVHCV